MAFRHRPHAYKAFRTAAGWELRAGDDFISQHRTFSEAVSAAGKHDRDRRRKRSVLLRGGVVVVCVALLIPVTTWREVDNPAYPEAREMADSMEEAYREVDDGLVDIASFTQETDGFSGGTFRLSRSGVESDYNVLAGDHKGDCYVIRWVRFEVPFVARLLPRFECEPGGATLNFSPTAFEEIAINLTSTHALEWQPVIPEPISLALWFFPAVLTLLAVGFQQISACDDSAVEGATIERR